MGMSAQLPIVEQLVINRAGVTLEQASYDGQRMHELHLDVVSGQTARRYTIRFDEQGWANFRSLVVAADSGIEIARAVPHDNGDPPADVFLGR